MLPNLFFLKEKYEGSESFFTFAGLVLCVLASFVFLSCITYLNKYLFVFFNSLLFFINSGASYFQFFYKVIISPTIILSVLHTDMNESTELVNATFIGWVFCFGILPSIILCYARFKLANINISFKRVIKLIATGLVILLIGVLLVGKNLTSLRRITNNLPSFLPYNYVIALKNYYIISRIDIKTEDINKLFPSYIDSNEEMNIVVIIGESSRSDKWHINGYGRGTSPNVDNTANLVSYKNAYSLATETSGGVFSIMKNSSYQNYSSFISIFNQLKFDTYWLSNQGTKYKKITAIAREAKLSLFSDDIRSGNTLGNNYDADLLPFIKEASNSNTSSKQKLIVVHTIGSHRLYDFRYPSEFKKFLPTCIGNDSFYSINECTDITKLNNSYDNSILYTDFFLSEVIKLFKDKKTLLVFVSDHGESLGEKGVFAHAYPLSNAPNEQTHIALMFWASDKWLENKDAMNKFDNIALNKDIKVDQSYIFHTVLDCAGVKSELIDKDKSLCQSLKTKSFESIGK